MYVKNVTLVVVELVRPLESVAVTVMDLDPALNTLDVKGEPDPEKAPDIVYDDMDAPDPGEAEDVTFIAEYPPTYSPLLLIHAFVLTGASVTVGAVGFILVGTTIVALYVAVPIVVLPDLVVSVNVTVPDVLLGSLA